MSSSRDEVPVYKTLNPTQLTPDDEEMLGRYLWQSTLDESYFSKNKTYQLRSCSSNQKTMTHITFTHDMVKIEDRSRCYYQVIGTDSASDVFADMHLLEGILRPLPAGGFSYEKSKHRMPIRTQFEFNPCEITREQSQFLLSIIEECSIYTQMVFFAKGFNKLRAGSSLYYFHLQHDLLFRQSESKPHEYRIEIIGEILGRGSYGIVYKSLGVLIPQDNDTMIYKPSKRVIKSQLHTKAYPTAQVRKEYELSRFVLRCKPPTIIDEQNSYLVMNYYEGVPLYTLLKKISVQHPLDTDTRLRIALELLYAYREQVNHFSIIHRDLKSENIMVAFNQEAITVKIIDFGLAITSEEKDTDFVGTCGYIAPELYEGKCATEKSDYFSLAMLLGEIFGAHEQDIYKKEGNQVDVKKAFNVAHRYDLFYKCRHVLECMPDLGQTFVHQIKALLTELSDPDPTRRCALQSAINVFDRIILERKFRLKDDTFIAELISAHALALEIQKLLAQAASIWFSDSEQLALIIDALREKLNVLGSSPVSMKEFIETLRITALQGLNSPQAILAQIKTIFTDYSARRIQFNQTLYTYKNLVDELSVSQTALTKSAMQTIVQLVYKQELRLQKYFPSVDGLLAITRKLDKDIAQMQAQIQRLQSATLLKEESLPSRKGFFAFYQIDRKEHSVAPAGPALRHSR